MANGNLTHQSEVSGIDMRIKRYIGELCIFKNRASSSMNERKAAEHIYQIMRSIGLVVKIDSFKSQQRMTWELVAIMSFFLVEAVLYFSMPALSLMVGLIGIALFWGYFTTRFKPLASLFRHSTSHNVVGRFVTSNAPYKVIFTAHHDTARSGPLWNPKTVANFRFNFLAGFFVLVALQIIALLKLLSIKTAVFEFIAIGIGIYVLGHILVLLYSGLKGELVQGASDNASGVAVMLDLAVRLKELSFPEIEFWFVSTGSEEVGAVGMAHFMKTYAEDIFKKSTYFINLDNLGSGKLHYFTGEGMLNFYGFSRDLISAAESASQIKPFTDITPAKYRLAYTDAIVPASKGFQSILLLASDERGLIPNWHWPTDVIENVDLSVLQLASDFATEMVTHLSEILKHRAEKNKEQIRQFQDEMAESVE